LSQDLLGFNNKQILYSNTVAIQLNV